MKRKEEVRLEKFRLEKARELILRIKKKYKLTSNEIKLLLEEPSFPLEIINKKLTVLESVVKYLKEEKEVSLHKISDFINRDERNIWHIYNRAKKKYPKMFDIKSIELLIPFSIFSNKKLSALEAVVSYLKEELHLNHHKIALLIKRDQRTIWTVYNRATRKRKLSGVPNKFETRNKRGVA